MTPDQGSQQQQNCPGPSDCAVSLCPILARLSWTPTRLIQLLFCASLALCFILIIVLLAQVSRAWDQMQREQKEMHVQLSQLSALLEEEPEAQDPTEREREVIRTELSQLSAQLKANLATQARDHAQSVQETIQTELSQLSAHLKVNLTTQDRECIQSVQETIQTELSQLSAQLKADLATQARDHAEGVQKKIQTELSQLSTQLKADLEARAQDMNKLIHLSGQLKNALGFMCKPCHQDWNSFQSSCYFFANTRENWEAANLSCQNLKGHLVIINSPKEQNFISQQLNNRQAWIGLSDQRTEGLWHWVDGMALTLQFWEIGEPNNAGNEDCAEMTNGRWNDVTCQKESLWICESQAFSCPSPDSDLT
ncbi:CD209 antigen-like protein B isoform X2 [Tachyglossus aculeatus]|nr:CD209 antigen-like protein B isoform X2 [Tachyglossus aculeatus]